MLVAEGLSKSFGALTALRDFSFSASAGQITSIIGPNGAGKSTAFNVLSGAIPPDAGRVMLEGRDVTGMPAYALNRLGVARSFQITNVFFGLTVAENLHLACHALEPRRRLMTRLGKFLDVRARVNQLMGEFGLDHAVDEPAASLSHGDQRRLEIALCMASRPKLLLLDEPTQGMSPAETAETDRLIKRIAGATTVVLIEHDLDLVMGISDCVVVMHQGAKLAEGTPEEVRSDHRVQEVYLGSDHGAA